MKLPQRIPQCSLLATYLAWIAVAWGHGFGHTCPQACGTCHHKCDSVAGVTTPDGNPSDKPAEDRDQHDKDRCLICQSIRAPVTTTSSVTVPQGFAFRCIDLGIPPDPLTSAVSLSTVLIRGPPSATTL
jgi:hypothetical protein